MRKRGKEQGGKTEEAFVGKTGLMFDGEVRKRGELGGRWRDSEAGGGVREGGLEDRASGWKSFELRRGGSSGQAGKDEVGPKKKRVDKKGLRCS